MLLDMLKQTGVTFISVWCPTRISVPHRHNTNTCDYLQLCYFSQIIIGTNMLVAGASYHR